MSALQSSFEPPRPSFAELYSPKLLTVLREGYDLGGFRADIVAGLTVAIVALPLSMAIAIASGVPPERGLYTSIVGGLLVSLLGGSRFQIGGPAGAFIVLVSTTVQTHGIDGLALATLMSGMMMLVIGWARLGVFIKFIPYPVTVGFTAGIAIIIASSQIIDFFGLHVSGHVPEELLPKLGAIAAAWQSITPSAFGLALMTVLVIAAIRHYRPNWPAMLIAVALAAVLTTVLHLPVDTIQTRFGGIPRSMPLPHLPPISYDRIIALLPAALSFTLLGSIESLLSAVVADSMTGRRHRSNCELVAQGVANIGSALFGGICVTGTIARTATNVRAGARGPLAGILHSLFLLILMLVAAPLAGYIPLAALAAVLMVVCWTMAERHAFGLLLRASRGDAIVLLATFLLTIFVGLSQGIVIGFSLSALLFLHRMTRLVRVEAGLPPLEEDMPDRVSERHAYERDIVGDDEVRVLRISGAFFFGTAAAVAAAIDAPGPSPRAYVLDMSGVPVFDSSAAAAIGGFARTAARRNVRVYIVGARAAIRHSLLRHGAGRPVVRYVSTLPQAMAAAHRLTSAS